jgi:hypothetical protein
MLEKYGYGSENVYDLIRQEIKKTPLFRFDWFLKSRTSEEIKRRCATLIALIQKEQNGLDHAEDDDDEEDEDEPKVKKGRETKERIQWILMVYDIAQENYKVQVWNNCRIQVKTPLEKVPLPSSLKQTVVYTLTHIVVPVMICNEIKNTTNDMGWVYACDTVINKIYLNHCQSQDLAHWVIWPHTLEGLTSSRFSRCSNSDCKTDGGSMPKIAFT